MNQRRKEGSVKQKVAIQVHDFNFHFSIVLQTRSSVCKNN